MKNDNLLTCEIVHRLRGRIRIKSKAFKYVGNSLKLEIEKHLLQVRYIKSVEISLITGTILIYFEDVSLSDQNLINLIQNTLNSHIFEICKNEKIEKSSKYVIERKLQEESPKEIVKKIIATAGLLGYNLFFKSKSTVALTGIRKFLNYNTLSTLALAMPVLKNGINSLIKNKRPNADTLSSSAIISSILLGKESAALTIMFLEEVSELLTVYTMEKTRGAIKDMLSVGENYVWKEISEDNVKRVPIEEIKKDDIIVVQTGEKISVDGKIIRGEALIDQSSITGEYMPIKKSVEDDVYAGTIVKNGNISIIAEKVGDDRTVSRIIKLVEDANSNKADIQNYADTFSAQLIPLNFILAGIVYASTRSLTKAMSMLVIDYSCGIRLSTAVAFSAAINTAAKNGILVKGSNFIEELSKAETVIFDKTGTITEGKPKVQSIEIFDNSISENEIIGLAGAAEEQSSHPLATSIMSEIKDRGIEIPKHNKIKTVVSRGVETKIGKGKEAVTIRVGSKKYMLENNIDLTLAIEAERGIISRSEIGLYVAQDEKIIGLIGVSDPPRENIKKAINRLRNYGVDDIVLLTGDLRQQAETIASRMSMDSYESELLPEDKAKNILKFQSKGSNVIMIGDGVNDAPALSYANVGVALGGTRTDVAMEAADITITQDNPLLVPGVIGLSKSTVKTIKENFAMVIGLNTFALVLGATGILAPIYASVLHNSTTILVVMNSLKLLKYDIKTN
ncbi:heavy metal translocating P-type ATPase [Fusobacterium vincentii]|uniref:heavy metal translocating P-type ATPase n=1 Tax=Fusobacterium vincentii TaxID=155615 RepID=UPI000406AE08|nr:heavy metal translocating P-type ATPase [Fusobacterium vincentii]ALF19500.1 ATPase P [Fusobacterium vincentii ChDC F8]ATV05859.1 heavy metal translocating P-type ATPase [Fusobacterium vincentii]PIH01134.1 heavy metal translocating P-type ATPase [Fusobacterium vincentii]BET14927.1 heavy metal translocating P-type ATPase [Fusobacterium vincentii]